MIRRLIPIAMTLAALALVAACERSTPTAPNVDVESILANVDPALTSELKPVASTLPALFREAIAKVETTEGRVGVQSLLGNWRGLQDELKDGATTADRAAVQAKVEAIHNEELKVVLRALGPSVLTRVMSELSVDVAAAQSQITNGAIAGDDAERALAIATQVTQKIGAARAALLLNHNTQALDLASQAATLLSGLDYYLIELQRIDGLENLYPRAVDKLKAAGDVNAVAAVERASLAARAALAAGDRGGAQSSLTEARGEQIRVVLKVLGPAAAGKLVDQIDARALKLHDAMTVLAANGEDIVRQQRMFNEAVDLAKRARIAHAAGDDFTALDLGSHAAGLLNALQHLTWK